MATVIKIKNIEEGFQSIITNGKHTIIGDEPITSKGTDLGLAPSELVLSGLAMCKVGTVRFYCSQKQLGDRECNSRTSARSSKRGRRAKNHYSN